MSTEEALFYRALYRIVYYTIVFVLTIYAMNQYKQVDSANVRVRKIDKGNQLAFFLSVVLAFLIGIRPHRGFEDTGNYVEEYQVKVGRLFDFDWSINNFLFDNLLNYFASIDIGVTVFFILIALIYFVGTVIACKRMFPGNTLLAFVAFLGAFSTFSYGTNGIKAGAAAAFFLLALSFRESKLIAAILLWLSLGFHHSMLTPIMAYIVCYIYKRDSVYLYFWFFCLLLAAAHVTFFQELFMGFTDEHGARYLDSSVEKTVTGFRPDFILYGFVPIIVGYYLMKKKHIHSISFSFIWRVYTLTNCVFLLCTYADFINRIAYLSWLMYPILLLYPFINITWASNQKKYVKYTVYGHLGFTLFMEIIYYGI